MVSFAGGRVNGVARHIGNLIFRVIDADILRDAIWRLRNAKARQKDSPICLLHIFFATCPCNEYKYLRTITFAQACSGL
jgi:hypothetical protein